MGTLMGRDGFGIPKKIAEDIQIVRSGDDVKAYVRRNGIKIIEVRLDLSAGKYNDDSCFFGNRKAGDSGYGGGFFFKYDIDQMDDRDCKFSNIRLLHHFSTTTTQSWEPGSIEVKMRPSANDPWSAFEVVNPWAADTLPRACTCSIRTFIRSETATKSCRLL
jgi:acetoacetate decarboxylase